MLVVLGLLAFVIEFAFMVGVFLLASALAGAGLGGSLAGVGAVVVVALLWGLFIAPRARRRIPKVSRALAAGGMVMVVGAGLLGLEHSRFGLVLIGAGLVLVLAQLALDDTDPRDGGTRHTGR
ncbi:DUF2568 domain-containing protein [Knoellia sp. Soil729]|uniref:DUF2568 domain-containing protein n=1 Tax=Knoellia sp. Soil729 TaxID=1736394 RepID=UPI0006F573B4|nr:DUF2568 domain-containing protein [Knoellia sp. Soil729]KRE42307.1 hypothetical protein ASG74_07650 [Knoellia sp. Soil729]